MANFQTTFVHNDGMSLGQADCTHLLVNCFPSEESRRPEVQETLPGQLTPTLTPDIETSWKEHRGLIRKYYSSGCQL